jgi:hypothetical protein
VPIFIRRVFKEMRRTQDRVALGASPPSADGSIL